MYLLAKIGVGRAENESLIFWGYGVWSIEPFLPLQGLTDPRNTPQVLPSKETLTCEPSSPSSPKILKLVDFDFTDEWEPASPKSKDVLGTDGHIWR